MQSRRLSDERSDQAERLIDLGVARANLSSRGWRPTSPATTAAILTGPRPVSPSALAPCSPAGADFVVATRPTGRFAPSGDRPGRAVSTSTGATTCATGRPTRRCRRDHPARPPAAHDQRGASAGCCGAGPAASPTTASWRSGPASRAATGLDARTPAVWISGGTGRDGAEPPRRTQGRLVLGRQPAHLARLRLLSHALSVGVAAAPSPASRAG